MGAHGMGDGSNKPFLDNLMCISNALLVLYLRCDLKAHNNNNNTTFLRNPSVESLMGNPETMRYFEKKGTKD